MAADVTPDGTADVTAALAAVVPDVISSGLPDVSMESLDVITAEELGTSDALTARAAENLGEALQHSDVEDQREAEGRADVGEVGERVPERGGEGDLLTSAVDVSADSAVGVTPIGKPSPAEARALVAGLVRGILGPKVVRKLVDRDDVKRLVEGLEDPEQRVAYRLVGMIEREASWIRPSVLLGVVKHWLAHRDTVRNPYSYYRPGSVGFQMVERLSRLAEDDGDWERLRREELEWKP